MDENFNEFLTSGVEVEENEEEEENIYMNEKILKDVVIKMPPLEQFNEQIAKLKTIQLKIYENKTPVNIGWLRINCQPLKTSLDVIVNNWINKYAGFLLNNVLTQIKNINEFVKEVDEGIKTLPQGAETEEDKALLMKVMEHLRDMKMIYDGTLELIDPMKNTVYVLKKNGISPEGDLLEIIEECKNKLKDVEDKANVAKEKILPLQTKETQNIKNGLEVFNNEVKVFRADFITNCPYHTESSSIDIIQRSYNKITEFYEQLLIFEGRAKEYNNQQTLFELQKSGYKQLKDCRHELVNLKYMWDMVFFVDSQFDSWKTTLWEKIDTEELVGQIRDIQTKVTSNTLSKNKEIKNWKAFASLNDRVKNMNTILPLISDLHSPYMKPRHWKQLMEITQQRIEFQNPNFCMDDLIALRLYKYPEEVSELVALAQKEDKIGARLLKIENNWSEIDFEFVEFKEANLFAPMDELVDDLELDSLDLMGMSTQRYVEFFRKTVDTWTKNLRTVEQVIVIWVKVQKKWQQLESIFLTSEDIRAQLPEDTKRFEQVDSDFRELMRTVFEAPGVVEVCTFENREDVLKGINESIDSCQKSLDEYLEQKKKAFARFYFVSNPALLDILSNANNPPRVAKYLKDCFVGLNMLEFCECAEGTIPNKAKAMMSMEGEYVKLKDVYTCEGAVETWLSNLEKMMKATLKDILELARGTADNWEIDSPSRQDWIHDYPAQISLLGSQIIWSEDVEKAFGDMEGGAENAMKDYSKIVKDRIQILIEKVRTDLTPEQRRKIITIITIDVHERDVVEYLIEAKISDQGAFGWQKQLKFAWKPDDGKEVGEKLCIINICDWKTYYSYEYLGNTERLVVTPLTDRCYITLTQALNLVMGGAPAGPAGTGKTETTKDLGRGLGLPVMVFNCSEQMSYLSMAQVFMGLSQSGAWGCFDEFNRISIEVLSVVSQQVNCILDALKEIKMNPQKSKMFLFLEETLIMVPTCGFFITMNPGYAGRTELPENLKALFRSCAMIVPDFVPICENMLMSEGFQNAKALAQKFVTLYSLSSALLSKSKHYDWGLRAVKSVLRMAGKLKRADPQIAEDPILMRALRDFNKPKIISDDKPIFFRLINDLFPGVEINPKLDEVLEKAVTEVTKVLEYQAESEFVLKCVQLAEILEVRHCFFVIGPPGSAKTTVWKCLAKAFTSIGQESVFDALNPKAITSNELYGFLTPKTGEWKDGVLSNIMRLMSNNELPYKDTQLQKWITLDGDVDPNWIESLNTVMDDNKMLTLVSNERIPLQSCMRILFEIANLKEATPATVSRGGVLFINESDIGWKPFMESWIERFRKPPLEELDPDENAHSGFYLSFNQYLSETYLEDIHGKQTIIPCMDIAFVQSICCIIDALYNDLYNINNKQAIEYMKELRKEATAENETKIKTIYEGFFIYAMMWSIGGGMADDRMSYNSWMKSISKIKFPEAGNCFDYYFDPMTGNWASWLDKVETYAPVPDQLFTNIVVPTLDTVRMKNVLRLHVQQGKPVLFVGAAGTGKTIIIKDFFSDIDTEKYLTCSINFNNYTDSRALQNFIEGKVEKRTGRNFGPPTNMKLIYFMDDLNMPQLDDFGTQSPIALVRQLIDHKLCFDRNNVDEKKFLCDCQYLGCMNPKAGSFLINPRLQRHYTVLACQTPESAVLNTIFSSILEPFLSGFDHTISSLTPKIVSGSIEIFNKIAMNPQFMPSAKKFHYQFNLRDLGKITQNVMLAQTSLYKGAPARFVKLWVHENNRVYQDRLIFEEDHREYLSYLKSATRSFEGVDQDELHQDCNLFTSFVNVYSGSDKAYLPVTEMAYLKECLDKRLEEYNENNPAMNLVLFDQAMEHICRISRIIDQPAGNALLIGVGGSGKQSLARLASFLLEYSVMQIAVSTSYGMNELKVDLQELFKKAAVKPGTPFVFLLADTQIQDEKFLIYVNDILSSGFISELFTKEEMDGIYGSLRNEAKSMGYMEEDIPAYFLDKARKNIHVVLGFSPVGEAFKKRVRKFPAIISCTTIDWFHDWPHVALIDVASRFNMDIPDLPSEEVRQAIGLNMAEVHTSINEANARYLQLERRHNYTTPKSFLELIDFYKTLLTKKRNYVEDQIRRLEQGLMTLDSTKKQVEGLQELLKIKMVDVEKARGETDALIEVVKGASVKADEEAANTQVEKDKTEIVAGDASKAKGEADEALKEAIPELEKAEKAVDCLTPKSIQEMKSLANPPEAVVKVAEAILILRGQKNREWPNAQKMMNPPQKFMDSLKAFDGKNIDEKYLEQVDPILKLDYFNPTDMEKKSLAASFLCNWVSSICRFNMIYKKVKPLQDSAADAQEKLRTAESELKIVEDKYKEVMDKVADLQAQLDGANEKKDVIEGEANELSSQLDLAERLVTGLGDENTRWGQNVAQLKIELVTLIGDALLSAAFVSYIGAFSAQFRRGLWVDQWLEDIKKRGIPFTEGVDPLYILANDSDMATWKNDNLPEDRVSLENAAVVVSCARWPLLIDPQLQGVQWIGSRKESDDELIRIQLSQDKWMNKVVNAITMGQTLLIESVGEEIDAVLDPLLSRSISRKGKTKLIKLGGEEIEYDDAFKLYLQTKLSNPHYRPETAAQCTLINFIVTEKGLEDQLLAFVVGMEKQELENTKKELVMKQNEYTVQLNTLENELLQKLSDADPTTILQNKPLIEGLEQTKRTAKEIALQTIEAQETEVKINQLREIYRRVAQEGSLLYFLINSLNIVDHMYQYSLGSFREFFQKAMERTEQCATEEKRVIALRAKIRFIIYEWVARGLFEKHKKIFLTQIVLRLMQKQILTEPYNNAEINFLLKCTPKIDTPNIVMKDWLQDSAWFSVQRMTELEGFENFAQSMESAPGRFKDWYNEITPEEVKLPLDWKKLEKMPVQKMLVLRCLRPDRITSYLDTFIKNVLDDGDTFVDLDSGLGFAEILSSSFDSSNNQTPILFILSPGADPISDVRLLGKKHNVTLNKNFWDVPMGQGQEKNAFDKMDMAHKEG